MGQYDAAFIGTALVDSIVRGFDPTPVSASGFRAVSGTLSPGGEAVNAAVAASKLGVRARIVCSLGADDAGELVLAALRKNGVDISAVLRSGEHPTPVSTLLVNRDGTRKSITNSAHRYNFHPERYARRFTGGRLVVLGSLFRAPFDEPGVIEGVLRAARRHNQLVLADTKLPNFNRLSLEDIAPLLPMIDYIFPNEDEARYYSGEETPERMAEVFLRYGVKNVVIKLGAQGCCLFNKDESIRAAGYAVDAVDATGAGDNFLAAFAAALLRGEKHASALRLANVCGAICATGIGAASALRDMEQAERFLAERGDCIQPEG